MPRLTPGEEEALADQLEADLDDPEAWEAEEASPPREGPVRLGAVVSVRFNAEDTERLRRAAGELGEPYTALIRRLVRERLDELEGRPLVARRQRVVLDVEVGADGGVQVRPHIDAA